jgi:hypothetical protein
VWRLKKIAKDGVYHEALKGVDINSVQDFLRSYYKDEEALRKVRCESFTFFVIFNIDGYNKLI